MISREEAAKVAVFAPLYPPAFRGGGPIRSIAALVRSAPESMKTFVLTSDTDLGSDSPLEVVANSWVGQGAVDVCYATLSSPRHLMRALLSLRRRQPTLLHLNSFMNPRLSILPVLLWRLGFWGRARVLLSPRGEFGDGALNRRSVKKRAYIRFFRLLGLHKAVVWHSTAPHETRDMKRIWGDSVTIIERVNDTLLPSSARVPVEHDGPLRAVFLGRIVEHKGLAIALEGLASVPVPVQLDVFGSREDQRYAARCDSLAASLPPRIVVNFHGPISPEAVVDALAEHDVLLMPTAGENFGHVIAEALSASCAVATTPHTPWTDALVAGGGIVLERTAKSWAQGLQLLATESSSDRLDRRHAAGAAYERWQTTQRGPHVWLSAWEMTKRDPQ